MKSDTELLATPLKDLTPEERKMAFAANDRRMAKIEEENNLWASKGGGIQIITDCVEVKSPIDGKIYTSKKKYYDHIEASGNHIVEKGEINLAPHREIRGDFDVSRELKQAIHQHLR